MPRGRYDDVNEFFWQPKKLGHLMPSLYASTAKQAVVNSYAELRGVLRKAKQARDGPVAFLRHYLTKTYREKISW